MSQLSLSDPNEDASSVSFTYPFLEGIDPGAPPATITIPNKYLDAMANMERQYWDIKSKHYNVMIFFKKGKFYELYDYDAVIANREFGLKMVLDTTNRGKMRLAGVPEQSLMEWARLFVFRGYKVGRVEQMKESEGETSGVKLKVMPRELIEVLTPGTLKDPVMISDHGELFVLALVPVRDADEVTIDAFAVDLSRRVALRCKCFSVQNTTGAEQRAVNSTSACKLEKDGDATLKDTTLRALSALLQQLDPKEVIMPEPGWASPSNGDAWCFREASETVLKWVASEGYVVEKIPQTSSADGTKDCILAEDVMISYFTSLRLSNEITLFQEATVYTAHLTNMADNGVSSNDSADTADRTTGRTTSLLDYERRFDKGLILDAATVSNLEVLTNLHDGTAKHSLQECLNHCRTNGGRRLFRSWLLRPSSNARVIEARQAAARFCAHFKLTSSLCEVDEPQQIGEKRSRSGESPDAFSAVASVDFERFLSRLSDMKQNDSQHISYVDPMIQYKKNLGIILSTVHALRAMVKWGQQFLARCREVASEQGMSIPPLLAEHLENIVAAETSTRVIESLFDHEAAEETGLLIPSPGTSSMYDAAAETLKQIESKLHDVRRQMQHDVFGGAQVHFSDLGKDLFLVEVSVADAPKMTPRGLVERARSSRSVKYVVSAIESLVEAHKEATASKAGALLTVLCQVAGRICDEFPRLFTASSSLSYVDCLLNLAAWQQCFPTTCYPQIVAQNGPQNKVAEVRGCDLVHPLLASQNPVPNTVCLDNKEGRVLLLTGPNMAGKSTLMRTVAINVLLAQLGGPVLGTRMELAPVDRIFTRIGARDASHKGQSTLYVELSETAEILLCATAQSLCLVDELGRGTSTHDGMAIAYATLHALTEAPLAAPLAIFSTHYHALAMEQTRISCAATAQTHAPTVQMGYMDFVLKSEAPPSVAAAAATSSTIPGDPFGNDNSENASRSCAPASALTSVVFLYRLVPGICARSYGVEVALMAGIPASLVHLAKSKSDSLSRNTAFHEDLRSLLKLTHL
ncbi:putative mismatch repair protein MSH8 [Leptomonas pyrrhocoris]|uniref:Putative mismatch repair protein MSH8 n=1 Tax=Leptomonas pyrrhocoris TaxID=157538 RepID=A0A0M9G1A1_LEPPY|nr:putative mismatch repair protein MSH8 [Leptomonas pyrrhocoris]KPA80136.1 putative mismatch repair protein MSH8 [Leptomonas pyrrhocoris]|eukprot:XP_015658575.1 putative mismatch repair protein MSH8 [Leptomonas pyrrhocoris]